MGLSELEVRRFWDMTPMGAETVDSIGRSGGLISLWNPDVFKVDQVIKNPKFLVVSGLMGDGVGRVNVVNLHAPNDPNLRRSLWTDLVSLLDQDNGAWILLGDFNELRSEEERVSSCFDRGSSEAFNGFISAAGLMEYSSCRGKFTFISGHYDVKMSILDRSLVNDTFLSSWPNAFVEVHKKCLSDHCPISLTCSSLDFGPIPFKFFNSWIGDKKLSDLVDSATQLSVKAGGWGAESNISILMTLKSLKANIKS
ncbi:uncharacterized protein LOC110923880 [Helianthus annuus]|uniref:uncharacterized protein LOC110923880 n=1 Tax=Helianthus annuus TaxID=4232 RepID=UPI000B8FC2C0|nr:uncharacterized protein LOC110923880 [Helianthus annuus]